MLSSERKLLDLLSNHDVTFFIPPYQRNYEWGEEQCAVFIEDVVKTYKFNRDGKSSEHFFGTITYFQSEVVFGQPNKLVLIDGQQRITTTMLFLVALRDLLGEEELECFIDSMYLKNNNVSGDSEYKIKLKQVESDWKVYKNIILKWELSAEEKNSAVYHNYEYFLNRLSDYKKEGYDLRELVKKGLNKFSVITIELHPDKNEWENPQEIFESMNSLGKPLSLADLVRNYLLLGLDADTQNSLYNQYWLHIEKVIPGKVSDFIRDYMQAHEKRSFKKATEKNYKELYSLFKKTFTNGKTENLLKDLSECATIYSYIIPGNTSGNKQIDNELQDLNELKVTTTYSFLLALLREWKQQELSDEDIVDILSALRIYCLRRRLIGLAGAENQKFPLLTRYIPELKLADDKQEKMFDIFSG